jgi:thiol-disulfide isomerase/thioredoxin
MRKLLTAALVLVAAVTATGAILYARNSTPVVPTIATADAAAAGAPWVVKLHAQWCPVCMMTKDMWSRIESDYAQRVRLAVFDFTDDETTAASRAEAERLGLGPFLDEAGIATGTIVVLDGRTKEILAWINGSRDFDEYRQAIDAAIDATEL